jgi:hypothetical protein
MSQRHAIHLNPEVCELAARGRDKGNVFKASISGLPRNLRLRGSSLPKLGEPVHPILEELETLERCQAERPLDESEVDPVGKLLGPGGVRRRLRGSGRRLGHEFTIARLETGRAKMFAYDSSTTFTATMRGPGRIPAFEKENA